MKKIELTKPLLLTSGKTVSAIELRDPTVGDVEQASGEKSTLAEDLKLLSMLVLDLSPEEVRLLLPKDFSTVMKHIKSFF